MSQDVTVGMRQELVFFSSYCPPIAPLFPPLFSPPGVAASSRQNQIKSL